jgi:hypothetical protein
MIYYERTEQVDYENYQHIAIALEEYKKNIDKEAPSINDLEDKPILRESVETVCQLVEEKVIPKSLLFHVVGYLDKQIDEGMELSVNNLIKSLILFDNNVKSIKQINLLRECKSTVERLFVEESEDAG